MSRLPSKGKFVKKPIPIYAEQWYPGEDVEGVTEIRHTQLGLIGQIETLEGPMTVIPGSYVITGIHGEKYACIEDIFLESYEEYDPDRHDK